MVSNETTKLNTFRSEDEQQKRKRRSRIEEREDDDTEANVEETEEKDEGTENEDEKSDQKELPQGSSFEKVLNDVGSEGRFQKFLIWGFVVPLAFCNALGNANTTLLLTTPGHSCQVPGRPVNVSLEEWKNFTIPWEKDSLGQIQRSSCKMFNISGTNFLEDGELDGQLRYRGHIEDKEGYIEDMEGHIEDMEGHIEYKEGYIEDMKGSIIDCQDGWDFDTSSWVETPVSQFGWVCHDRGTVTSLFSLKYAGNAIGTLVFSVISDRYGRKPAIFLVLAINASCILPFIFAPNLLVYGIFIFLISSAFNSLYQIPYIIVLELCGVKSRLILMVTSFVSNVFGTCLVPVIAFLVARWKVFVLVCHLPPAVFFLYYRFVPESPRWLLSEGRLSDCEGILRRIARRNGKPFEEGARRLLQKAKEEEEEMKGSIGNILLSATLAKHLLLTCALLSIGFFVFSSMMLNIHNMSGSKFINFFLLSFVGVPADIVGGTCSKYLGRRFSATLFYGLTALSCFLTTLVVEYPWLLTAVCSAVKMFGSAGILTVYMQVGELFPTSLRATAYGVVCITASVFAVFVPPVVAMGGSNIFAPYYVVGGLGVLGLILSTFLPETLGRPLPQTVHEALAIGRNQPYFVLIHKWNAHKYQV